MLVLLSGCSIDGFENNSVPVTNEETQLAGQIIGESISENQSGMLSTFSEAFAVPTSSGLISGPSLLSTGSFRNLENYTHTYNQESGQHQVSYTLRRDTPLLNSSADVSLTYIFYDSAENRIEFPGQDANRIEAVDFSSEQSGTITTGTKNSVFTRTDRILINGLTDGSETLTLDGFHSGSGIFTTTPATGNQLQREYTLDMNYLDVRINKAVVLANRNFRNGVNGALSYESTVRNIDVNSGGAKVVNGTIELNGDGTALLNFREQLDPIRLRLDDGDLFDEDEFEGRIIQLDLDIQTFTIANGQRIRIDNQTQIDEGDYLSLNDIAIALDNNRRIVAEGEYFHPDENVNLWVATEVEFEEESNEFDDLIESVSIPVNSITLINGDQLFLTAESDIEFDDSLTSLQDVADAVESGLPVAAEGDFSVDPDNGNRIISEVGFQLGFDEFEAVVTAADSVANLFTLSNGRDVLVTPDTQIEGDFNTLTEVSDALSEGLVVEAKGEYYPGSSGDIWIVINVNFEEEEDDDDD
jgi:hypothetical protein